DPAGKSDWPEHDPSHARGWLGRGGRIAVLGRGEGTILRHGQSDVDWIATRWAAWLNSVPTAAWHGDVTQAKTYPGSIVGTRAVLRMLAALDANADAIGRVPGVLSVCEVL